MHYLTLSLLGISLVATSITYSAAPNKEKETEVEECTHIAWPIMRFIVQHGRNPNRSLVGIPDWKPLYEQADVLREVFKTCRGMNKQEYFSSDNKAVPTDAQIQAEILKCLRNCPRQALDCRTDLIVKRLVRTDAQIKAENLKCLRNCSRQALDCRTDLIVKRLVQSDPEIFLRHPSEMRRQINEMESTTK